MCSYYPLYSKDNYSDYIFISLWVCVCERERVRESVWEREREFICILSNCSLKISFYDYHNLLCFLLYLCIALNESNSYKNEVFATVLFFYFRTEVIYRARTKHIHPAGFVIWFLKFKYSLDNLFKKAFEYIHIRVSYIYVYIYACVWMLLTSATYIDTYK